MKFKNSDNPIDKITRLIETDNAQDAPADAIKWAKNIYRTRVVKPKPSVLSQIAAVLKIDLSLAPGMAERSAGAQTEKQLLFEAGDSAIDIRISKSGDKFTVRGQVLGVGYENCGVTLTGETEHSTRSNELCEFVLEGIDPGVFALTISGGQQIAIEHLEIKD